MYWINFSHYKKEAEMPGGDYWKFLDATEEVLETEGIYLDGIPNVMKQITNEELKMKMKNKLYSLAMKNGATYNGMLNCLSLFSDEEVKSVFESELNVKVFERLSDEEKIRRYSGDVYYFVTNLRYVKDEVWELGIINSILDKVKEATDKTLLIELIEYKKRSKEIHDKLVIDYYQYLPEEYRVLLRMRKDSSYLYNKALSFRNENLDIGIDPRISIAPEIEANKRFPYEIDLCDQLGFEGEFRVTSDATVPNGNEIIPRKPFHNTPEEVAKFCALCDSMKDIGYYYSEENGNAAGQINLGLDYLDTKEAILAFYEIYGNCEELLYYISSEEGQIFRQSIYCSSRIKPLSEIIGSRLVEEDLSREEVIRLFSNDNDRDSGIKGLSYKKNSVCLRGTTNRDYRFEFRIPNGGCNYRTWIDNIRLYGKMMERAKQIADMSKKEYLTPEEEQLLGLKIDLQDRRLSLEDKLDILMDLLFDDEEIKQIYYARYKATLRKIIETGTENYDNRYSYYEPGFDEVEFIEHYESRLDPEYDGYGVVTYDPETDEMKVGRRK